MSRRLAMRQRMEWKIEKRSVERRIQTIPKTRLQIENSILKIFQPNILRFGYGSTALVLNVK